MRSQATVLVGKGGETDKRSWHWKGIAAPNWSERVQNIYRQQDRETATAYGA